MKTKSAKAKGRQLESYIVERLRASGLDVQAQRTPGSGTGKDKGDIWNKLGFCFECKNTRIFPGIGAQRQLEKAAGSSVGVLVWHPPGTPLSATRIVMSWEKFEALLLEVKKGNATQK